MDALLRNQRRAGEADPDTRSAMTGAVALSAEEPVSSGRKCRVLPPAASAVSKSVHVQVSLTRCALLSATSPLSASGDRDIQLAYTRGVDLCADILI